MINNNLYKKIKFLLIGSLNATIYFIILLSTNYISENRYISLIISQVIITVIAFYTFSKFTFQSTIDYKTFAKFVFSNIFMYLTGNIIIYFMNLINVTDIVYVTMNIIILTPISYMVNSKFVFKTLKEN
jgi:putative flippase GtrA